MLTLFNQISLNKDKSALIHYSAPYFRNTTVRTTLIKHAFIMKITTLGAFYIHTTAQAIQ